MGWEPWERYESKPRRPANGIKAQSRSGKFGQTWWAGRWLAALDRLIDSGRLSRGRSYARSGQVLNLDVGSSGVSARVQGSRVTPYKVSIRFRTLPEEEWEKVVDAVASQAIYAARLLCGEMPEQIQEVFEVAGASLFPAKGSDLETQCSCPDHANPCKHIAAVYYLLGERFDTDPFLIFEMRGRSKEAIIASLRAKRTGELAPEEQAAEEVTEDDQSVAPLSESLENFWSVPAGVLDMPMDFSEPPVHALPVKRLGQPAFWRGKGDFTEIMERAYKAIGDRALRLVMGDE